MSWCNSRRSLDRSHVCERDKWSENKLCRLVCLYERFPCLWKKDNPSYMDNSRRHSAYGNIHQGMEMPSVTFTEVMIKIRELRRAYVEELRKILMARKVGRRYEPRKKWFLSLHKFLYEHLDFDEVAELQVKDAFKKILFSTSDKFLIMISTPRRTPRTRAAPATDEMTRKTRVRSTSTQTVTAMLTQASMSQ